MRTWVLRLAIGQELHVASQEQVGKYSWNKGVLHAASGAPMLPTLIHVYTKNVLRIASSLLFAKSVFIP